MLIGVFVYAKVFVERIASKFARPAGCRVASVSLPTMTKFLTYFTVSGENTVGELQALLDEVLLAILCAL